MSQANALLNSLTDEELAAFTAEPETEEHIVIGHDRFITVPESLKRIAVQYDHNIETVMFDCPRYWDNSDMSTMKVYINYMCPGGTLGSYIADNVVVDDSDSSIMHFSWTISRNVTFVDGTLTFLVCVKNTDSNGIEQNHWNSELNNDMYVSKGLECGESIIDLHPDILTQILLLNQITLSRAAVYVGSGDMPAGYNVQIDPDGDEYAFNPVRKTDDMTQPVGIDSEGRLYTAPTNSSGGDSVSEDMIATDEEIAEMLDEVFGDLGTG